MPLYRPSELTAFLKSVGRKAKKSLSQNFLIDQHVLEKMVQAIDFRPHQTVLEIGPGPGVLTEALVGRGAEVIAIEKDPVFASHLSRLGPIKVIHGDALTDEIPLPKEKIPLVGNLPYQITTPLIERFIPQHDQFSSLIIMVQKEYGERLVAVPKTPAYSSLTLFARYYCKPTYLFTVKPQSFLPPPKVHSCVVKLDLIKPKDPPPFALTRPAFSKRRKMLRSSLSELYLASAVEKALQEIGHLVTARPEELSLEDFFALDRLLSPKK